MQMTQSRLNTEPTFAARTQRLLSKYGGQYIEQFLWEPIADASGVDDENTLLDVYEFYDQPKLGPMLVYQRDLDPALSPDELRSYFEGNLAPRQSLGNIVEDISAVSPIDEDTFWALIGTPTGNSVSEHLEEVRARLTATRVMVVKGFLNRLALLLHGLDRPAYSLHPQSEETGEDVSLTLRCWAILRGAEFYAGVLRVPESLVWVDEARRSEELVDIVSSRVSEDLGVAFAFITTTERWFTGSNVEYWGPEATAQPAVVAMPTEDERIAEWNSSWPPKLRVDLWGEEDALWDDAASRWWTWVSVRAISSDASSTKESIALMAKPSQMSLDDVETTLKAFIEQTSSTTIVVGLSEVYDSHISRLSDRAPSFFEIRRPAKAKLAAYIEKCLLGP